MTEGGSTGGRIGYRPKGAGRKPLSRTAKRSERRPGRLRSWLRRPKLWDDVFTRTVANLLSVGVIALFAVSTGLVHVHRHTWANIWVYTTMGALAILFLETPWRPLPSYVRSPDRLTFKAKWRRAVAEAIIFAVLAGPTWLIYRLIKG